MNQQYLDPFLDKLNADIEALMQKHSTWELIVTCVNGRASYSVKSYSQTYILSDDHSDGYLSFADTSSNAVHPN